MEGRNVRFVILWWHADDHPAQTLRAWGTYPSHEAAQEAMVAIPEAEGYCTAIVPLEDADKVWEP